MSEDARLKSEKAHRRNQQQRAAMRLYKYGCNSSERRKRKQPTEDELETQNPQEEFEND